MAEKDAKGDSRGSGEVILGYVTALVWPFVAIVVLVAFWRPLQDIARLAPDLLADTESIKLGSVSLQVRTRLAKQAPDAVRLVLQRLQPEDFREILSVSTSNEGKQAGGTMIFYDENPIALERYRRFADLNLVTSLTAAELEDAKTRDKRPARGFAGFRLTPLWDQTSDFLIALIPQLLKEVGGERVFERNKN
jgi:hypothetical protein